MKIKETFMSFTGIINVGIYAYFINIDDDGIEIDNTKLAKDAMHFNRVVLYGKEVFEQKEDIAKFIKKLVKLNRDIKIEIHTKGTIKPIQIGSIENIEYFVNLQLKNSNIPYEKRIREGSVNWFNEMKANFLFNINNDDDMDEANMLIRNNLISKNQIFLALFDEVASNQLDLLIKYANFYKYNFVIDYKKMFWSNIGKHNNIEVKVNERYTK